jgi:DNA modification methylase
MFDGVITDPPYKGAIKGKLGEKEFDFDLFMQKTDSETSSNSFLIIFTNFICAVDYVNASRKTNWEYHTVVNWDKRPIRTWIAWSYPLRVSEYILFFKKGNFQFNFRKGTEVPGYKRSKFGGSLKETGQKESWITGVKEPRY